MKMLFVGLMWLAMSAGLLQAAAPAPLPTIPLTPNFAVPTPAPATAPADQLAIVPEEPALTVDATATLAAPAAAPTPMPGQGVQPSVPALTNPVAGPVPAATSPALAATPDQSVQSAIATPVAPPAPAPVPDQSAQPAPAAAPQPDEFGVETIDIESGGNWLIKRAIWEDAQRLYDKINSLLTDILNSRINFFDIRTNSDRALITFFVGSGFAQGELHDALEDMLARIKQDGMPAQEVQAQQAVQANEKRLEQLRADVQAIGDFDAALDNALTEMMKQIDRSADYERQGWQRFKEIGQEIDDRKARVSYAHMDAAYKNMQAISDYLNGPYADYLTAASQKLISLTDTVKTQLADLASAGITLKKQLTDIELAEAAAREKEDFERQEKAEQEKAAAMKAKQRWYNSIAFVWEYPISLVSRALSWATSMFGGKATIKPMVAAVRKEAPSDQTPTSK